LKENKELYKILREKHSQFIFESFDLNVDDLQIQVKFNFWLDDVCSFQPTLSIPVNRNFRKFDQAILETFVFNIGMIELISYWKAACPPQIVIKPYFLSDDQIKWWKKIYFHGLGEFFYLNGIIEEQDSFVDIVCEATQTFQKVDAAVEDKILIPIGGGKDSVVSLELLKKHFEVIPLILNPRGANLATIESGGFKQEDAFLMSRTIDPQLLALNAKGYLNGHTPFSAMLAFNCVLASYLTGAKHIALSNESSANEPTDPVSGVNHQYSKSLEFEADFRNYISEYVWPQVNYFSFLRPFSELQIAALFSKFNQHHSTFRSCNVGSKSDSWCGSCPKCLFTYIILLPFIEHSKLNSIFEKDLLLDLSLKPTLDELTGAASVKPFECVGTTSEVNLALTYFIDKYPGVLPDLLKDYLQSKQYNPLVEHDFKVLLKQLDEHHFLTDDFVEILKTALHA
jgi:hypothetical protein